MAGFMMLAARTAAKLKPASISLFIVELPNPAVASLAGSRVPIRSSWSA